MPNQPKCKATEHDLELHEHLQQLMLPYCSRCDPLLLDGHRFSLPSTQGLVFVLCTLVKL